MKKVILILVFTCFSIVGYSQEKTPKVIDAGRNVVIVFDNPTPNSALKFEYTCDSLQRFGLRDDGKFNIYDLKSGKVFTANSINKDLNTDKPYTVYIDGRETKIKGK